MINKLLSNIYFSFFCIIVLLSFSNRSIGQITDNSNSIVKETDDTEEEVIDLTEMNFDYSEGEIPSYSIIPDDKVIRLDDKDRSKSDIASDEKKKKTSVMIQDIPKSSSIDDTSIIDEGFIRYPEKTKPLFEDEKTTEKAKQEELVPEFQPGKKKEAIIKPKPATVEEKLEVVEEKKEQQIEDIEDKKLKILAVKFTNLSKSSLYNYYARYIPYYILVYFPRHDWELYRYNNIRIDNTENMTENQILEASYRQAVKAAKDIEADVIIVGNYKIKYRTNETHDLYVRSKAIWVSTGEVIRVCVLKAKVSKTFTGNFGLDSYTPTFKIGKALAPCNEEGITNFKPTKIIEPPSDKPRGGMSPLKEPPAPPEIKPPLDEPVTDIPQEYPPEIKYYWHAGFKAGLIFSSLNHEASKTTPGFSFNGFIYYDPFENFEFEFDIIYHVRSYGFDTAKIPAELGETSVSTNVLSFPLPVIFRPKIYFEDVFKKYDKLKTYLSFGLRMNFVTSKSVETNAQYQTDIEENVVSSDLHFQLGLGFAYSLSKSTDLILDIHYLWGIGSSFDESPLMNTTAAFTGPQVFLGLKLWDF